MSETFVLVKACVVKHGQTKVVPRVIDPVLGNRDGIFCAQKNSMSQNQKERMYEI